MKSSLRRALALLTLALVGVLSLGAGTALADNEVVSSEPANGATLATSPSQLVFTFTEEVGDLRVVSVLCNAEPFTEVSAPSLSGNLRVMTVEIPNSNLPGGLCVATWSVSDTDEEANGTGQISFSIDADPATTTEPAAGTAPTTTVSSNGLVLTPVDTGLGDDTAAADTEIVDLNAVTTGEGPLWLGRVLSTIGIAIVFGALFVIATAWPEGVEYRMTIGFLRGAWILAFVGTLLFTAAAASAVSGSSLGSGLSPGSWGDLFSAGWSGRAALLRLVFVVAAAWAAFGPHRVIDPVTQMAGLGIPALAVAMVGVGRVDGSLVLLGVVLGIAHALAMAIWIGGVILLARVVLYGPGEEDLVHAVRGFSRISVLAIVVTIATGLAQMIRLDGGDFFRSGHGQVTFLKVILVAAMIFIGLSARQFAQQRLARAHEMTAPMADRLKRAFGAEAAFGVATLLASAFLLALTPARVDNTPRIDYEIERQVQAPDSDNTLLDVVVKLTDDQVGPIGLEVQVNVPTEGLTALELVFTPPIGSGAGAIVQPVPLTGAGRAVRTEANGLPIGVGGDWQLQINANIGGTVISSDPIAISFLTAEGVAPTTSITVPAPVLVPISTTIPE